MPESPTPAEERAEIRIDLGLPSGADAAEIESATTRLRTELLELPVDRVERPLGGDAPAGARVAEVLALGGLLVTLGRNAGTIASVVRGLQGWLARDRNRTVSLEIDGDKLEVTGISSTEQERLIDAWISRHATS
jgi:hypothetical protein